MIDQFTIETTMNDTMCGTCKKINPEYFEMKLQIRLKHFDETLKIKEQVLKVLMENFNTINKIDELDDGYEVFFRDHGQMNKVNTLFGRRWLILDQRSSKIMGQDKLTMKSLYRHTQLITILNIQTKDIVEIKGKTYWIKAINKGGALVLREFGTGKKSVITYKMAKDYFRLVEKYDPNDMSHPANSHLNEPEMDEN